ncbi:MAG: M23 family metallopeptidase [Pseudomonadota bacterium]
MKSHVASLLLLSASALAGCGASSNSAPIVYGTNPAASGTIYNSPADVYLAPDARRPQPVSYGAATYSAETYQAQPQLQPKPRQIRATPASRPAPLTQPVYQETLPPEPIFVAETDPVATPRAAWAQGAAGSVVSVQQGETVYAISRRTGASPLAIINENRLAPPYALKIGQTLRIPSASAKVANTLTQPAPRAAAAPAPAPAFQAVTVQPGDTLYAVSRRTGASVSALAQANGLRAPYTLSVGQRLRLPSGAAAAAARDLPASTGFTQTVAYKAPDAIAPAVFDWPVKGAVIGRFGEGDLGRRNDGINIAAPVGTPVRAAAAGEVVYRGAELDGYGNLLLIKHDDGFVTAYAHNDAMLVRKGQRVRQGQVIAKVGQTGAAAEPQLHFEIRQNLKSVDPLAFLQR